MHNCHFLEDQFRYSSHNKKGDISVYVLEIISKIVIEQLISVSIHQNDIQDNCAVRDNWL